MAGRGPFLDGVCLNHLSADRRQEMRVKRDQYIISFSMLVSFSDLNTRKYIPGVRPSNGMVYRRFRNDSRFREYAAVKFPEEFIIWSSVAFKGESDSR